MNFLGWMVKDYFLKFHLASVRQQLTPKQRSRCTLPMTRLQKDDKMRMLLLAGVALLATTAMASATTKTGYLAITDASTIASLGWVSQTLNPYGEYIVTIDTADRLQVSYDDT